MAYATVAELRQYLPQVQKNTEQDDLLGVMLDRATSIIDGVLGFSFAAYPAAAARTVYADSTEYLLLPVVKVDSVTSVLDADSVAITGYGTKQVRQRLYLYQPTGWPVTPISVTGQWGYGPAPASVVQVCLELAVNNWRAKDRGLFSDVIGVETGSAGALGNTGAVVGYAGALTNQQKMVLGGIKRNYEAVSI